MQIDDYAHIKSGVIYNISQTKEDDKQDSEIQLTNDNCPTINVIFEGYNDLNKIIYLNKYITNGDLYQYDKFVPNYNDETLKSYFDLYVRDISNIIINQINNIKDNEELDKIIENVIPYYLKAQTGTTSYCGKEYNYRVEVKNDGVYKAFDINPLIYQKATEQANDVLKSINKKLTNEINEGNCSDM